MKGVNMKALHVKRKSRSPLPAETTEELEARLLAYGLRTRDRTTRTVRASVPTNVTVLAGPRRRVAIG
jgi:hypothetical protein